MANSSNSVQIKDYPNKVVSPEGAPKWFTDYVQSVEQWSREMAIALRQAQSKIAALEGK